jgi:hypothetical protein
MPGFGVKVTWSVTDCPAVTLTEGKVAAIEKPGAITVTFAVV